MRERRADRRIGTLNFARAVQAVRAIADRACCGMSVEEASQGDDVRARKRSRWLRWLLVGAVLLVVGVGWAFLPLGAWLAVFARWINSLGTFGVVGFAVVYALSTILIIPGAPMTIAAGVAYGWWGVPLVLVSASVGSMLAFLASRYWFNDRIRAFTATRPRFRSAVDAVNEESWTVLALMRLSPVLPFNIQNYLLGLTAITLSSFFASTTAGMIPGAVLYTYLGILGLDAGQGSGNIAKWTLLILGLIATVFVTMLISRRAKAKLEAQAGAVSTA